MNAWPNWPSAQALAVQAKPDMKLSPRLPHFVWSANPLTGEPGKAGSAVFPERPWLRRP
ncbi:hypothetical protein GCM10023165_22190 [Variovorax defluvii]|uniref:Uncharacterized protein n=1 Tax=Variovorax defluvii TaxID=913761 RepID=A0ABP8HMQ4_9BURK